MENAAKALEMAAGVLLGVILMALVAYFFTQISSWPQNEEDIMSREQLAKFNLEYEVYNKSKMYGVDVISCLNKVISNNEKYAQGGAFLGGNASLGDYKQRENYWINVKLKLKKNKDDKNVSAVSGTTLYETIEVYHYDLNNKEALRTNATPADEKGNKLGTVSIASIKELSKAIDKVGNYTSLKDETVLPATNQLEDERTVNIFTNSTYMIDGYISLTYRDASKDNGISDMNPEIVDLLKQIQAISTADSSSGFTYVFKNKTKSDYRIWTQVKWETVLHDLKSRKFTCTDFTYNTTTGRVNEIVFEEI